MLTSPISSTPRKTRKKRIDSDECDSEHDYLGVVVSGNEDHSEYQEPAFERMPKSRSKPRKQEPRSVEFGPPITSDNRMDYLSEIHQIMVHQFVDKAKAVEEQIRNKTTARRPFFTEAQLREMAIRWTLNTGDMAKIEGINVERVNCYGKVFIPIIRDFHNQYNDMMNDEYDKDMDPNHRNVIDLCSDGESEEDFEDDLDEEVEEAESRYFAEPSKSPPLTRNLPWATDYVGPSASAKKSFSSKSTFTKAKGRGRSRKSIPRKSYGSNSGGSSSGVTKRRLSGGARKPRGASKLSGTSASKSNSNLSSRFGYPRGGRSGDNVIGMMPT
jgi:bloom syndrome protein